MPLTDTTQTFADLHNSRDNIVEISPGMFADTDEDGVLIVHLGAIIESLGLDDTQECRASIYGAWRRFCDGAGVELILILEPDAPSVHTKG